MYRARVFFLCFYYVICCQMWSCEITEKFKLAKFAVFTPFVMVVQLSNMKGINSRQTSDQRPQSKCIPRCWIKVIWISCWCRVYIILGHSIFYIDTVDIYIFWLKYAPSQLKHPCQPHGAFLNIQFGVSIYHVNSDMNIYISLWQH